MAFDTLPRLPRALTYAGNSRQAVGGTLERKVPSGRAATCQDVRPIRPLTVIVTSSSDLKPAPHMEAPTVMGGATAATGCAHTRMWAWPDCGTLGWGGNETGQPIGFAVIAGHWFGPSDGFVSGLCAGAGWGFEDVASSPGVAVATFAARLDLGVEAEPRLTPAVDVQAAVSSPTSRTALRVACLVMATEL